MQPQSADPFSDDVLMALERLAAPLELALREPFLTAVTLELRRRPADEIGPGTVSRVARELQREFRQAPRHLRDPKY